MEQDVASSEDHPRGRLVDTDSVQGRQSMRVLSFNLLPCVSASLRENLFLIQFSAFRIPPFFIAFRLSSSLSFLTDMADPYIPQRAKMGSLLGSHLLTKPTEVWFQNG